MKTPIAAEYFGCIGSRCHFLDRYLWTVTLSPWKHAIVTVEFPTRQRPGFVAMAKPVCPIICRSLKTNLHPMKLYQGLLFLFSLNRAAAQLTRFVDAISLQICQRTMNLISTSLQDCTCDGSFTITEGLVVTISCESSGERCLGPLCGTAVTDITVTPFGLKHVELCVIVGQQDIPFCLDGEFNGFRQFARVNDCGIAIGQSDCDCQVCEDRRSITYDCSSFNLGFFRGPKIDNCAGITSLGNFLDFASDQVASDAIQSIGMASEMSVEDGGDFRHEEAVGDVDGVFDD